MQDAILQFVPLTILGLVWAFPIYFTAKKRGVNPWPWVIACIIPIVSIIAIPAFWIVTIMSILDRLKQLEAGSTF